MTTPSEMTQEQAKATKQAKPAKPAAKQAKPAKPAKQVTKQAKPQVLKIGGYAVSIDTLVHRGKSTGCAIGRIVAAMKEHGGGKSVIAADLTAHAKPDIALAKKLSEDGKVTASDYRLYSRAVRLVNALADFVS